MPNRKRPATAIPSREIRLQEFFSRLERQPPFSTLDQAYAALVATLEEVEDELAGIENNPSQWQVDGRLYPPQEDHWVPEAGFPGVVRMRTRGHYVLISAHGALEIQDVKTKAVLFSKAGSNGRKVWDL